MPTISVKLVGDASSLERSFKRASSSTKHFERDIGRGTRGGVAASGAFKGLGHSIAFASASFIGGAGIVASLKASVGAAKDAQVAQAQLRAQLLASGISYKAHRAEITETLNKQGEMSGFLNTDLKASFTGFVRRTGNVNQALKLNAVAVDIARAKHKDLASVQQQLVRALAGNARAATSLGLPVINVTKNMDALRNSGVKATAQQLRQAKAADKLATGQAVIASAQRRYGGQAAAFGRTSAGAQARFERSLHETEVTIGNALLPTLTKLFQKLSTYLNKLNSTGRLQRIVAQTAHAVGRAFNIVVGVVQALAPVVSRVVGVLGGARNAFKLLAVAVLVFKLRGVGLANPYLIGFAAIAAGAVIVANKIKNLQKTALDAKNRKAGKGTLVPALVPRLAAQINDLKAHGVNHGLIIAILRKQLGGGLIGDDLIAQALDFSTKTPNKVKSQILAAVAARAKTAKAAAAKTAGAASPVARATLAQALAARKAAAAAARAVVQGNQFFDSKIDRSLSHAQDLAAPAQVAALGKIAAQIRARIARTKDITRKLNLEDKLLDVLRQKREARKQAAEDRLAALTSREFRQLGLTGTGEEKTIGKKGLKRQLGSVEAAVKGTFLDTAKTRSLLARIRKVLSEGLVPKDVRAKMKDMLDGLTAQLGGHAKNQTKFRHKNTAALLTGLGLSAAQIRLIRARLAQVGAGGTAPAGGSAAFAGAGATTTVHTTVNLDGKKVAHNTTHHQRKAKGRRSGSRRGPYAGHG